MKVLYVGYYKEAGDWGLFTKNNILALSSAGVDVACRPIVLSNGSTPKDLVDLEKKSIEDCDVCIQHVFPDHMLYSSKFKTNIAVLSNDFYEIKHSTWVEKLDRMDQVWVPSQLAKNILDETILRDKTRVVPVCFDSSKYLQSSATFEPGLEAQGKFRFYAISNDEKNVDKVIKCFHSEFDHSDNAVLVIQINQNKDGTSKIDEKIYEVKKSLGLNKEPTLYKKDIVVEKPVRADSTSMHQFGDCYVSVSSRRTINSEDIDAMGFGNTPIVSDQSDAAEYVDKQYCVKSLFKINTNQSAWRDVNNGKDYQIDTCEKEIKSMMRRLYEEWCQNPMRYKASKRQEGITRINTFSIDSVGKTMKELLNA